MMNEFMNKSVDKKYLLWTAFDEDEDEDSGLNTFEIHEFRVCDCYLDWILYFQNKNKNTVFSEEFTTSFFDEIPSNNIACDVFSIFGKVTIVCCRRALYHFFYKEDVQHEKLSDECLGYDIECCCMYLLEKKLFFPYLCSNCQFNFIKNVSNRFIKIKND